MKNKNDETSNASKYHVQDSSILILNKIFK